MRTAKYRIVSCWRVEADLDEVASVFRDSESLVGWWPAAFLQARVLCEGDECEIGKRVWLHTKGWLPYTLRLTFEVVRCRYPESFELAVEGDFEGSCVCRVKQDPSFVSLEFDWAVEVKKPLVRHLSWLLRPVFAANHRWVMRRGRESLLLELTRRRSEAVATVASPPRPTFPFDPVSLRIRSWLAAR